jgi:serine/threonine protein kinase
MENIVIDGRYHLVEELGSGGEARVYLARDLTTGAEVALRVALRPGMKQAAVVIPDFHDNWVRLLDAGTDYQRGAYQAFELLHGQTLADQIASAPLAAEAWRRFVDQSLEAVDALHKSGWVHGDLNAGNFMLTAISWKLLELPFLRFESHRSPLFGSIYTLAPEQFDGATADFRSDLYSLGCLYYYAASGTWPHPGANSQEVAIHCLRFEPEPLERKAPTVSPRLCGWVMQLVASNPDLRFPTVMAARHVLGVA